MRRSTARTKGKRRRKCEEKTRISEGMDGRGGSKSKTNRGGDHKNPTTVHGIESV